MNSETRTKRLVLFGSIAPKLHAFHMICGSWKRSSNGWTCTMTENWTSKNLMQSRMRSHSFVGK
jgi:hypothetical protein